MFVSINSNTTNVTSGAETAYTSRPREFTPVLSSVHIEQSSVFCRVTWWSITAINYHIHNYYITGYVTRETLWVWLVVQELPNPSAATENSPTISLVCFPVLQSFVWFIVICISMFVFFLLDIVLSVVWFVASDKLFGIIKVFFFCVICELWTRRLCCTCRSTCCLDLWLTTWC